MAIIQYTKDQAALVFPSVDQNFPHASHLYMSDNPDPDNALEELRTFIATHRGRTSVYGYGVNKIPVASASVADGIDYQLMVQFRDWKQTGKARDA